MNSVLQVTRLTSLHMSVRYDFTSRTHSHCGEHAGQEFLGDFGKGLATIDSHREWRDVPEFVRRSKSDRR